VAKARGPYIHRKRAWDIPEREVTPEHVYLGRRELLAAMGVGAGALLIGSGVEAQAPSAIAPEVRARFPGTPNAGYVLDRPLTERSVAARYNNYYEFSTDKERVAELAARFQARPWTIEVRGHCRRPGRFDVDRLIRELPMEERRYRFRCVEAWAMAVPWNGFPLSALLARVEPTSEARFVRFVSFQRPEQAPGQRTQTWYPWPYFEALRMDEAMNELTLLAVGIYGAPLPNQHGAPIRLVTPWKYGYKSPKGIVRIELVDRQPPTFWNQLQPLEYSFLSNVNPAVPHPRWSQASERMIGTGERRPTQLYNGYAEQVARLYRDPERG
jgi:sulfoxide reductase catalytic subunit YedY